MILLKKSSSLLAVGITKVVGKFKAGSVVELRGEDGQPIGKGICAFTSQELKRVKGKRSADFVKEDRELAKKPVIHVDQLFIL